MDIHLDEHNALPLLFWFSLFMHTWMQAWVHTCIHTCKHIFTQMHTQHMHIHAHTKKEKKRTVKLRPDILCCSNESFFAIHFY